MSYPLWEVPLLGGGLLIAIVAVLHVFVSQFAVGGGLFLALAGHYAYKTNDVHWLDYLKRHTKFFLLVTTVFGAVSGVGIWFTIGLISPQATSVLIRTFVWGWAIEWCFFLIEIAAILLYYYGWNRLDAKTHQFLAWVYAISSFLTLAVINGIVAFMLTPGQWLETGSFWHGWINPSYFPGLIGRTAASLALAGLYGLVTSVWQGLPEVKERLITYAAKFVLVAFALFAVASVWWMAVIPTNARELAMGGAAPVAIMNAMTFVFSAIILLAVFFGPYRRPLQTSITFAVVMLTLGLLATGGAEWVREGVRKPFVVYDYLYSNGHFVWEQPDPKGVMQKAKWSVYGSVAAAPSLRAAGEDLFRLECASCHTVNGYNGIRPLVKGWTAEFTYDQIGRLSMLKGYMPPFMGNDEERQALAAYLVSLNEKEAMVNATAER
ncbi:MAG: cytochrome ubiquinol oxidase subunit I [Bacillota bacterium]